MNRTEMTDLITRKLKTESGKIRQDWTTRHPGMPTRFAYVDELLPDAVARQIHKAFPQDADGFYTRGTFREHKRTSGNLDQLPRILADITYALQDKDVVSLIGDLTSMAHLEPDPHLYAGGLSMMFKGEFLNPHIDNSHEATKSKYRRLNLLYYVSPDWKTDNGGNLELWDDAVTSPVTVVAKFNRLVLMETNKRSWHSVSPLKVEGPRCCVSNYYFSKASPTGDDYYHVTSFTGRPEQKLRRAFGVIDNTARTLARKLGAKRSSDQGYTGTLAEED